MSGGAVSVAVLSVAGMFAELTGIIMVSGRGPVVRDALRNRWHGFRRRIGHPPPLVLQIGRVEETSRAFEIEATLGSDTRIDRIDRRIERLQARATEIEDAHEETMKRLRELQEGLPAHIRTYAVAPIPGVSLLVLGLACFVAANIIGVTVA